MCKKDKQENDDKPKEPYEKYKQAKLSPDDPIKKGPYEDDQRQCRDCFCCIFFIIFILAVIAVAYLGIFYGNPNAILYPYDVDGNQCGYDEGYKDYKYLYFYKFLEDTENYFKDNLESAINLNTSKVINITKMHVFCVKECKYINETDDGTKYQMDCIGVNDNKDCKVDKKEYYESIPVMDRFCFPKTKEKEMPWTKETIDGEEKEIMYKDEYQKYKEDDSIISLSLVNTDKLITWIEDLYKGWLCILGSLIWSFVLGILFLVLVRFCAGFIIYTSIVIILAALVALGFFLFKKRDFYDPVNDSGYHKAFLALAWVCWALALIWLIFILVMCNRIRLAVNLMEVTAKYIHQTCSVLFLPLLFFVLMGAWITFWIIVSVFLYSTGEFDAEKTNVIGEIIWDNKTRYAWWFFLFALLYICETLKALGQFIYASAASIWYFNYEKGTEERPVAKSFKRAFRFHFGSLAFGALIIAIIRFIMILLEYAKKQVDATLGKKSKKGKIYKCVICICECCMACVERCMEFINKHAYIEIALKGKSFCSAAWDGFGLIIRNLGRFSSLALIGSFFNIFGILFVGCASGLIGFLLLTELPYYEDKITSPILPVFAMAVIGFVLGAIIMSVFGTSADALMHCFLCDEEVNKGQAKCFPELQKFMQDERD